MASGNGCIKHGSFPTFSQGNLAAPCCGKKYIFGYKNTIYQELYFAIPMVIDICGRPEIIDLSNPINNWFDRITFFCNSKKSQDYFPRNCNAVWPHYKTTVIEVIEIKPAVLLKCNKVKSIFD
jgi:hypothetical protein